MSTPLTLQAFRTLFPEFKKTPDATIEAYLNIAVGRVPVNIWKANTNYATALLLAHMLSTQGAQGGGPTGGAVTQEQVGDLSRSFQAVFEPGSGDAVLMTTRYGIDFVALRKETIPTATVARTPRPPLPGCW